MSATRSITKRVTSFRVAASFAALLAAACQSAPPVQEMSDARQAVAVAIRAGAEQSATAALRRAQEYLESAQRNLTARAFDAARIDAQQAKNKALEALAAAERNRPE